LRAAFARSAAARRRVASSLAVSASSRLSSASASASSAARRSRFAALSIASARASAARALADLRRCAVLDAQPEDLPEGFDRFDEGRLGPTDAPAGQRRDPARFGRTGGWKARYRAIGDARGGMLLIESRIDAFAEPAGAEQELDAYRDQVVAEEADIGDEALVTTARQEAEPRPIRFTTVAWRQGGVTASVLVQGFEDALRPESVLQLARKQEERIARESD
jgi:hypothetical protein